MTPVISRHNVHGLSVYICAGFFFVFVFFKVLNNAVGDGSASMLLF